MHIRTNYGRQPEVRTGFDVRELGLTTLPLNQV
jgi:hypothetical protein